jgi:hypothetical protein
VFDTARSTIATLASQFDAHALDGADAALAVRELGLIKRLVDGMLAKAANRVHETAAHVGSGERDAAYFVAYAAGIEANEARRAMVTAWQLESLPAVDAAVRDGRLSARHAELIADTAAAHPESEQRLLAAAKVGTRALRDACQQVQANNENPTERAKRQHASRA